MTEPPHPPADMWALPAPQAQPRHQRGMVLIITLLALAILLIASVALMHSSRGTTLLAGNVAIKRDLVNQSERGFAEAQAKLAGPQLGSNDARGTDLLTVNYVSYQLPANAKGIPTVLVNDSSFTAMHLSGADIVDDSAGIRIRYVIDRMCRNSGSFSADSCQSVQMDGDAGGSDHPPRPSGEIRPVYRITVRVTDVRRNTQMFAQQVLRG